MKFLTKNDRFQRNSEEEKTLKIHKMFANFEEKKSEMFEFGAVQRVVNLIALVNRGY